MDKELLTSMYVEEKVKKSEQQEWEEAQAAKARIGDGGRRRSRKRGNHTRHDDQIQEEEPTAGYDFVFDEEEQIEFEMKNQNKWYDNRTKRKGAQV